MTLAVAARPLCGSETPELHWQSVASLLPLGDWEFGMQDVQMIAREAPVVVEYVLAWQSMQELALKTPATVEYLPAPQSIQELARKAPVVSRYLPAPQSVHWTEPIAALYFPATQASQSTPSAPVYPA